MSKSRYFTEDEVQYIKVNILCKTVAQIAKELGRNYWSVHRVLKTRLNYTNNHKFTKDEDDYIRKNYKTYRATYIASKLGIDENSVYNRARKLGIIKNNLHKQE